MNTLYGEISTAKYKDYVKSIISRIYAILPMKEEGIVSVPDYISNLNVELIEHYKIFNNCEKMLAVVCILENIKEESKHDIYRRQVLHCCNLIAEEVGDNDV